ncbi:unnamed protein product (macronuclear) [Paramecium tetraurelia]|uniref:KHDC4/BBP-like KH-domain type I domain-containing protein n=1 Tax=Paramecium tetraurelia TaxID=5888 RepID=A0EF38_PARTE|nr:uncharacterized protein GSPATT00026252001 [Paramecium tetraurelia]CAK93929.1 unnamed protein product [Paramecium tetraurelia]|eukprot:XP_001461302.1 hypothetical protein (macronuclear) [Paramecium tetraurelia strain d4-2]
MSFQEISQQIEDMTNFLLEQSDDSLVNASPTNREQINLIIHDQKVKQRISAMLKQKSRQYPHQYLTVELSSEDNYEIELDQDDIKQVTRILYQKLRFVKILERSNKSIQRSMAPIIIKFNSVFDAFIVYKLLNKHQIKELDVTIKIEFTSQQDLLEIMEIQDSNQQKFTCRYDVQIDNDKDFQVARKIIGAKGCNMKKIIDQYLVKLRLRGRGSGYKEGPEKRESQEPLHLCVSSKHNHLFLRACQLVEQLLIKIYDEYKMFGLSKGKKSFNFGIKKVQQPLKSVIKPNFMPELPNFNFSNNQFVDFNNENMMVYSNLPNQLM